MYLDPEQRKKKGTKGKTERAEKKKKSISQNLQNSIKIK
jgi:hypothetical protein